MSAINPSLPTVDINDRIAGQSPVLPSTGLGGSNPQAVGSAQLGASFAQALRAASQGITLSGHAQTRLASRQISLSDSDLTKLSDAMQKAETKGAKSSLVLMNRPNQAQIGLVVSIPNRTVITAVDTNSLKENIFTNIDSAMVI